MSRLLAIVALLAEINFSCMPTTACEAEDDEGCAAPLDESESESESESDEDDDEDQEPRPDLGG